jgi:hypothetical protein
MKIKLKKMPLGKRDKKKEKMTHSCKDGAWGLTLFYPYDKLVLFEVWKYQTQKGVRKKWLYM